MRHPVNTNHNNECLCDSSVRLCLAVAARCNVQPLCAVAYVWQYDYNVNIVEQTVV